MKVNIQSAMEGRERVYTPFQEKINFLKELKLELENDPKVQAYFSTKGKIEELFEEKEKAIKDYNRTIQNDCTHPLWVAIYDKEESKWLRYGTNICECVVCGERRELYDYECGKLYKKKKLLADCDCSTDFCDGRDVWTCKPRFNIYAVRDFYLKAYTFYKTIDSDIISEENIPSPEEMTFEYFINISKGKNKQKTIGAKTSTK